VPRAVRTGGATVDEELRHRAMKLRCPEDAREDDSPAISLRTAEALPMLASAVFLPKAGSHRISNRSTLSDRSQMILDVATAA